MKTPDSSKPLDRPVGGVASPPLMNLRQLLGHLAETYRRAAPELLGAGLTPPALEQRLASLELALAALGDLSSGDLSQGDLGPGDVSRVGLGQTATARPPQIAVVGPTQVGKSTVVNLLLGIQGSAHAGVQGAGVSPLAGFTVHPQGFGLDIDAEDLDWLAAFMADRERCAIDALSPDRLDVYGFSVLTGIGRRCDGPTHCVIWDTPDFDSLSSHTYRQGVLHLLALADVLVLVLSKEKYADLSVWRMLELIQPLLMASGGRRLLICLNKMTADAEQALTDSLRQRLSGSAASLAETKILALPYHPGLDSLASDQWPQGVSALRYEVAALTEESEGAARAEGARALVAQHWSAWTAPVTAEHGAEASWHSQIDQAVAEALLAYRRDYLDHPQRYDAFRRAVAQLLVLLEVPGLAKPLARVRTALTWPARRLWQARQHWSHKDQAARAAAVDNEALVLHDALEHLLTGLMRDVMRRGEAVEPLAPWWQALSRRLNVEQQALEDHFEQAARQHHEAFRHEIQGAANRLFARLQEKPALLNTLRAARATTEAAAVAVAVKTGGLGLNDLLLTPAMLSLTTMITEGALGKYMAGVAEELRERQFQAVRTQIFFQAVTPRLQGLAVALEGPGVFGVSPQQFAAAQAELETRRYE